MSLSIKVLFLAIFTGFISCSPRNLEDRRKYSNRGPSSETLNLLYFKAISKIAEDYQEIVENYKESKDEMEEQIATYNKMVEISYQINKKYSQYIENQDLVEEELVQIQSQLEELNEALSEAEASDEVKSMLESIKADLENLINQAFPIKIDLEVVDSKAEDAGEVQQDEAEDAGEVQQDEAEDAGEVQQDEAGDAGEVQQDEAGDAGEVQQDEVSDDEASGG